MRTTSTHDDAERSSGAPCAIVLRGVGKTFRAPATLSGLARGRLRGPSFTALADVSLRVEVGTALGVMGPNGAGKSTLLRILAGLLVPTTGDVRVVGIDPRTGSTALARAIGSMPADERGLQTPLSAREHLVWYAALYGFSRAESLDRVDARLDDVGLAAHARRPLRELSTGMRRRVALARALLGDPRVLLLDEPTRGVDPAGATSLHQYLQRAMDKGCAIVIATHDRDEARVLCRQVAVMDSGRVVALDAPERAAARVLELHLG